MSERAETESLMSRRLESLIDAVNRINTLRPLNELLLELANEGARALDAQRCTVWMLDREHNELYTRVAMGIPDEPLRMPADCGIAGDVLRTGRLSNVPDASADPRFNPTLGQSPDFKTRSMLTVPMITRDGQSIGVFQILNKTDGTAFDEADERLAQAFTSATAVAIQNAREFEEVQRDRDELDSTNARLQMTLEHSFCASEIVGNSPQIQAVLDTARRVSDTDVSVLITGESGTGKTLLAKCLHFSSRRRNKPFIDVNCAAIPDTLLEAELFGIEKGVATGVERRVGKLEAAHGGTIFLDEIADMSLATQAKILRVVQEKRFERVGSQRTRSVDVRILSATHRNLEEEIRAGRFREDLFYRLNVVTLHLPPLRERREDIPAMALRILERLRQRFGRSAAGFTPEALNRLAAYDWPGNVRELENEIARSLILAVDRRELALEDLSEKIRGAAPPASVSASGDAALGGTLPERVESLERRMIDDARRAAAGNKSHMARLLGLSREGLRKKLLRYGMA